ncbi:MAG: hypothetical protein M1822_005721 [Bathelium mastoideum]|nr:MAG: hypothetical protein M1822_005721 [Bathelium mastoideum]
MAKSKKTKIPHDKSMAKRSNPTPSSPSTASSTLAGLRADSNLWYKICVLNYDLSNPKKDHNSEMRTLCTTDELYISTPYFSPDEATRIKSAILDDGSTIEQAITSSLTNFFEKRRASGDSRPCGPHDMAPVYRLCFGIEKAEIEDKKFLSRLRRSGLAT